MSAFLLGSACRDAALPTAPDITGPVAAVGSEGDEGGDVAATATATVSTDKDDYAPGETVTISGAGFWPDEEVSLLLEEDAENHGPRQWSIAAEADGSFVDTSFSPEEHDIGVTFTLTATGQQSGLVAQTTFTDGSFFLRSNLPAGTLIDVPFRVFGTGFEPANLNCTPAGTDFISTALNVNSTASVITASPNTLRSIKFTPPAVTGYVFQGYSLLTAPATIISTDPAECFPGTAGGVNPVYILNYVQPPKLEFITGPFTGSVGECLGPMSVQSQDFGGSPLAVDADLTVNLSAANLGVGSINATPGAGSFFSNGTCTTGTTTTTISNGNTNSSNFYYRATGRGDGGHDLIAGATNYTPDASQTQTINKALTTLVYTGQRVVFVGNSFTFSATLSSAWAPCKDNKRILFRIIPSPLGGAFFDAPAPHPMTNSSGMTTKSVPTDGWAEDIYDARASFSGDDDCEASKDDYSVAVLTPGGAATGGGFLAGSKVGGGRANFAFNIRPIEGSDPIAYKGQFLLIRQDGGEPSFRCKGAIELYGTVSGSEPLLNVATGKCDFQVWNPTLNDEGGWEVPYGAGYTNRPFTIQFIDNGTGSKGKNAPPPDEFGFSINFVGFAVSDPSFDIAPINGGNIDVKDSGGSNTSTSGTTEPSSPTKGGGRKK